MRGCLKVTLIIVLSVLGAVIILALTCVVFGIRSNRHEATRRDKPAATERQMVPKATTIKVPVYEVVAKNPNGRKIFIVTQAKTATQVRAIVRDYKKHHVTPSSPWMINFFTDKEKALRVQREWLEPPVGDYENWVYREDVDHSGTAQWTSWDGVSLDKW